MDRERLDQWCERGIFGVALALLVFAPLALGAVGAFQFLVLQGLACGVLVLWMVRLWAKPTFRLLWPPICWPVLAFLGYAIVRYHYADIEYVARLELIKVLVYAAVFFAVLNNLNRQDLSLALCVGLIFVAGADSLYAIFQFASHSDKVWGVHRPFEYYGHRAGGTFINPNHLAGFLEMIAPVAISLVAAGRVSHAFKVVLAYLAGLMLIAVGLTLSRGGFVAVAVSLPALLLVLVSRRNYRLPALCLLVALGWAGYYFTNHSQDLDHRFKEFSATGGFGDARSHIWQGAWQMWLDQPWFGVGPGHFDARFAQYRPRWVQARPQYAHNDYLNTLDDWGAVGGGLLALALVLFFWGVVKTWPFIHRAGNALQAKKSNKPAIVLGGATAIFAMLVHAVTEFNLQIPSNALLAVAWLALVSSYLRFATEGYWVTLRSVGKAVATLVLGVAFLFLATQGLRRAAASRRVWQADHAASPDLSVSRLQQALAAEPMDEETAYTLAEADRQISLQEREGDQQSAHQAMAWFERGMDLNPWNPYNYIGYGQCLDWLGQPRRATPFFDRAVALDPNNSFIQYRRGKHAIELEAYREARRWLGRALLLEPFHLPPPARTLYETILPRRIQEAESRPATASPAAK